MLCDLRIRLQKPFLGDKLGNDNTRRFPRASSGDDWLTVNISQWQWAVKEAAKSLKFSDDIDVTAVYFPVNFRKPRLVLYTRHWHNGSKRVPEFFESIEANNILSYEIQLPHEAENRRKRPPTLDELRKLMCFVGAYIGLSPWGSKFGYGRFSVESLSESIEMQGHQWNLQTTINRHLPEKFFNQHRPMADTVRIFGKPITALNREELLAVCVAYDHTSAGRPHADDSGQQ